MKKLILVVLGIMLLLPIVAKADRYTDFLDEMRNTTQAAFREWRDASEELRRAEQTMRDRGSDWLRRHPEERDRAREHIAELSVRERELRERHRCFANVTDEAIAEYREIKKQRIIILQIDNLLEWEARWRNRFNECR